MIPTIGFMIGCYIITRMVAIATRTGDRSETGLVKGLAIVTALVAAWGIVSLMASGSDLASSLR